MTSESKTFCRCQCFFSRNYYVHDYDIHLEYFGNDEQFLRANTETLRQKGCDTEEKISRLLDQIKLEYKRRKNLDSESLRRRHKIQAEYNPMHDEIYTLKTEYLQKEFLEIVKHAKSAEASLESLVKMLQPEKAPRVYRLPVFTSGFCEMFLEEIEHFEASRMPKGRPNTMNKSGVLIGEAGFDDKFITPLREKYLLPLAKLLYPEWCAAGLDSHKSFTVRYKEGEDLDLGFHFDNSEVTLNVSLGKDFEDGTLYFGSMRQEAARMDQTTEVKHCTGEGILHRGQHRHGAMPISYGERVNLIVWMRSSEVRSKLCPMCDSEPILAPATGFGDGFCKAKVQDLQVCSLN